MAALRKWKNIDGLLSLTNILVLLKNRGGVYSVSIHYCSGAWSGNMDHNEEAEEMSTRLQSQKILQGDVEIERWFY